MAKDAACRCLSDLQWCRHKGWPLSTPFDSDQTCFEKKSLCHTLTFLSHFNKHCYSSHVHEAYFFLGFNFLLRNKCPSKHDKHMGRHQMSVIVDWDKTRFPKRNFDWTDMLRKFWSHFDSFLSFFTSFTDVLQTRYIEWVPQLAGINPDFHVVLTLIGRLCCHKTGLSNMRQKDSMSKNGRCLHCTIALAFN